MPKRPQAQKHIFWVWNMRNLETWFQMLKNCGPWALWAPGALGPTPFRLCRRALRVFFFGKNSVPNRNDAYLLKNDVFSLYWPMLISI